MTEATEMVKLQQCRFSNRWSIAAIAYIIVWALTLFAMVNLKFDRKIDWNTGMYANAARNLLHEGFGALHGGVYMLPGDFPLDDRDFYPGHPPLLSWMLAGWMAMFGQSEESIRALPLLFTAINLVLIYFLTARVLHPPAGLAATVICSVLPMTAYYATSLNMEWFTTTAMLGASLAYLRYVKCGCRWAVAILFTCVVLGCWMDWPMHIFCGILAAAHWLACRKVLSDERRATSAHSSLIAHRSALALPIALIAVPVLMFVAFAVYVHLNGASVTALIEHAKVRSGVSDSGAVAAQGSSGDPTPYHTMFKMLIGRRAELEEWFIDYFTYPALLLGFIGAIAWKWWTPALARNEDSRRTLFRILAVFVLTQAVYTLAFAEGALRHEFWNYYLIVPVAILSGGLCVSLTLRDAARSPLIGALDRIGWAVALLIPLMAYASLMRLWHGGGFDWQRVGYANELMHHTTPRDAIFTDRRIGYALSWYADRMVFYNKDFLSMEGLTAPALANGQSWVQAYSEPEHRLLYLWEDARSEEKVESLRALSKPFEAALIAHYGPPYQAGEKLTFFVLHGTPNPDWKRQEPPASMPTTQP